MVVLVRVDSSRLVLNMSHFHLLSVTQRLLHSSPCVLIRLGCNYHVISSFMAGFVSKLLQFTLGHCVLVTYDTAQVWPNNTYYPAHRIITE